MPAMAIEQNSQSDLCTRPIGLASLESLGLQASDEVRSLQQHICGSLEEVEARHAREPGQAARFRYDTWERPGGGGGLSAVLSDGAFFEKAGVNVSKVFGRFPPEFAATMPGDGLDFFATGISLVLHPRNPYVPTTHANFRFLRRGGKGWFGGGIDLTPYYPFFEDVVEFHRTLKEACERHDPSYYPRFKAWCDQYFFLKHRAETRGIGGLFFDYLSDETADSLTRSHAFWRDVSEAFLPAYLPMVERRGHTPYGQRERQFQLYRRGRYVEFNLLYDRGTMFGLKTDGRVESILMSLPPLVRWEYDYRPEAGSPEAALADFLRPRDWLAEAAELVR
jgi:coproporphyrinogen III oxidase